MTNVEMVLGALRATGAALTDDLDRTRDVRDWARAEGFTRAQEAFIVDGFKRERILSGLRESV